MSKYVSRTLIGLTLTLLNPKDPTIVYAAPPAPVTPNGSLTLFIQRNSPGQGKEDNWLPAPASERQQPPTVNEQARMT